MAEIRLRNLVKRFGAEQQAATDDVSLDVADGEFVVILGPSGCGKTTLLRMVAGLELPTSGQVAIGSRDVTYLPPRDRRLSMVFQSYAVFPHKKVRDNIAFGLAMRGVSKQRIREQVAWAADVLQLTPYLDRHPAQLSGGQRQRVAVARAIVVDADALLMDEPLSNLDALLRMSFRAELKKLVKDVGITTLYVTHDQVEALSLGDRIVVMRDGRIEQIGSPIDIYDVPASEFVGGFIGSPPMNFLAATIVVNGRIEADLGGVTVPAPAQLAGWQGRPLHLGIRAESIKLSDQRAEGAVAATLEVFEPLGAATLLTTDVSGQTVKVQAPATFRAEPGDRLWLELAEPHQRWFDAETQTALVT
jgi:multiple sugar transport system ATP-binding protein